MFIGLKLVSGILYLKFLSERVKISKRVFVLNVELGYETFIPPDLSQDSLPKSFRYYDCILNYVTENMKPERVEFFCLKRSI